MDAPFKASNLGALQTSITVQPVEKSLKSCELTLDLNANNKSTGRVILPLKALGPLQSPRRVIISRLMLNYRMLWKESSRKNRLSRMAVKHLHWLLGKGHSYYEACKVALTPLQKAA